MKNPFLACRIRLFTIVPLFAILSFGCANLSAIREFADASAKTAEYTRLVNDYVETPSRQLSYPGLRLSESQRQNVEERKKSRQAQKKELLLRQSIIEEYMDTLGELASDDVVTYDKEINRLSEAVSTAKFMEAKEADAYSTLAKLILRASADAWRQGKLKQFIEDGNQPFQIAVQALIKIVEKGFAGDIKDERDFINKHYTSILVESKDKAGIIALEEWNQVKNNALDERSKNITIYIDALTTISKGHQELYDQRNGLSSKILLDTMAQYAEDLQKAYNALNNL
jgi:hypothetical protein